MTEPLNKHPLPTEPGYYRRLFPDTARGGVALCTLYVFNNDELGGLCFQFVSSPVGPKDSGSSLPLSLTLFGVGNAHKWHGPFATREEAEAHAVAADEPEGANERTPDERFGRRFAELRRELGYKSPEHPS